MAEVRLADIYNPLLFNGAMQEAAIERNAFVASGVAVSDPLVTQLANGPGNIGDLPFFAGLGNPQADGTNEPDYVTDNPASNSTPAKISGSKMIWRKALMHKSWSTMDLARDLALQDPMTAITNRIGTYWATNGQQRLIRSCMGILADNIASDSGDMRYTIATDDAGSITAAEKVSPDAVITAKATMGDAAGELVAIAMHSVVYSELQRQNVIETELDPAGQRVLFETYLGYRIVVDDSMPAVAGSNRITYTTILFAAGAFAYGQGTPLVPSELYRSPSAGDGGGQDTIHTRATEIWHPAGFEFTSASVAGQTPTFAELETAGNWNRVYAERKNIGIAFLQTNG